MREFLAAHPTVRTALRVFVYGFLSVFLPSLFGWLNDVREWADGESPAFPAVSVLAKAAVAAASGALAAAFAVGWNKSPFTKSSVYVNPPAGDADPLIVVEPVG